MESLRRFNVEFITAEQLKEQPKEIQKVFLDWWKPSNGDIYLDVYMNNKVIECCHHIKFMNNEDINYMKEDNDAIPLFTEGQLRKFIEDKTSGIVKLIQWHIEDGQISKRGYVIDILRKNEYHVTYHYQDLGGDLLQAYWKVACIIAKEEVDGQRII